MVDPALATLRSVTGGKEKESNNAMGRDVFDWYQIGIFFSFSTAKISVKLAGGN